MLRNPQPYKFLLSQFSNPPRYFHQHHGVLYNKSSSNVFRQGKIMGKLFGNRIAGSKKRWFPHAEATSPEFAGSAFRDSQFGKTHNSGGKNATRRMTVLNKLFMKHITDLMATGEISEIILGKGLQVSRVKISQDFANINVFWLTTGESIQDASLDEELKRCSGLLRHELSQLGLMGVVPRIKFVKDKLFSNVAQVEVLLKNIDFDEKETHEVEQEGTKYVTDLVKQDFYYSNEMSPIANNNTQLVAELQELENQNKSDILNLPKMRHDVMGLDHKGIMLKIYTKMRKSKQAWEQHHQNLSKEQNPPSVTINHVPETQLDKKNDRLAKSAENSDKFEAFLAKRKERKNTPERKKYRQVDHHLDLATTDSHDNEVVLSSHQRQRYEADDYLFEDAENKKL